MHSSIVVIAMAIAFASSAPLNTPSDVISAPFTNPTVLSVQNSQIFLRNYKAIPSRIITPAAYTLPNGLQAIGSIETDAITRLRPVDGSLAVVDKIETPVAALKTVEPEVVSTPVESNLVETVPAVAAPLSLPIAKAAPLAVAKTEVAAPLAVPVAKAAIAAPLTSAVAVPLSAPLVKSAPLLSSPYLTYPYISSPYVAAPYLSQYITQTVF